MDESTDHIKGSALGVLARWLGGILLLGLCAAIIYPIFTPAHDSGPRKCISYLKQLATVVIIYQSDSDDRLPPYFTFDGAEKTKQFMTATMPYCKNELLYLCPQDKGDTTQNQEGLPGKMSFVHCLSLKRIIPDFNTGNRTVMVDEKFPNQATTAYLRDPIRPNAEEGNKKICSPHGDGFYVSYLDTHVKFRKPIDINTEL